MEEIKEYKEKLDAFIKEQSVPKDMEVAEPKKERKKPKKKPNQIFFMNK